MIKGLLPAIIGTVVGLITGNRIGEYLCGMILKSFGADRFHFVIDWNKTLFLIPIISLTAAGTAVWIGIMAIKKVKAFECCMGMDQPSAGKQYGTLHGEDVYTTKESECLMRLPMYYSLSMDDVKYVTDCLLEYYGE